MNTAVETQPLKPQVIVTTDYQDFSKQAALTVKECLEKKPNATICLPSGDTPIGMFRELVAMHQRNEVDFSKMMFIGLDEWVGMDQHTEGSCSYYVYKEFINPVGLRADQVHTFNAKAPDLQAECVKMDQVIAQHGGLDLIIVGLGMNGHIALNEPGYAWDLLSHVSELHPTTMAVGQKYFKSETALKQGITLGLKHLMNSKQAVLIANGAKKAEVVAKVMHGEISEQLPASIMRTHPNGLLIVDREAAEQIGEY